MTVVVVRMVMMMVMIMIILMTTTMTKMNNIDVMDKNFNVVQVLVKFILAG